MKRLSATLMVTGASGGNNLHDLIKTYFSLRIRLSKYINQIPARPQQPIRGSTSVCVSGSPRDWTIGNRSALLRKTQARAIGNVRSLCAPPPPSRGNLLSLLWMAVQTIDTGMPYQNVVDPWKYCPKTCTIIYMDAMHIYFINKCTHT